MEQRLYTEETHSLIKAFETHTKVQVHDCMDAGAKLIFIVPEGHGKRAIGPRGEVITRLREKLARHIQIVEFSPDPATFIKNIFFNYKPTRVEIVDRGYQKHATVYVAAVNKARAIGAQGANLRIARDILFRHFDIESLSVSGE